MKRTGPTNPATKALIEALKTSEANVWKDVAKRLGKPTRQRASVNLSRLSRNTAKGDTVVVPGKVLGSGNLEHAITLGALSFSSGAEDKIKASGAKPMSISELMKANPKGSKVKLMI